MQARQTELNADGWDVVDLPEMGVGIGVNTGHVIAGTVGGGGRLEYTVVGDAVNIASRLQNEADGGEIVATASTVAAAPDRVAASRSASAHVKGREEAVEVFRVVGWSRATEPRSIEDTTGWQLSLVVAARRPSWA